MTDIDVCNLASLKLGNADNYIDSFSDETKEARAFNLCYASVRDQVLGAFPWNFAAARAKITVDVTAPAFGFGYRHAVPSDCLALRVVSDNELFTEPHPKWKREGNYILSDVSGDLYVLYTFRHTTSTLWDTRFVQAFASRLALEVMDSLIGASESKAQVLMAAYKALLSEGHRIDATEDNPAPSGTYSMSLIR